VNQLKILILGGTGLISTAITKEFLRKGDDVYLYNRGITPKRFPPGAKVIIGDRNDFTHFDQQMSDAGFFDCVIDMICFNKEQAESDIRAFRDRIGHLIFCSTVNVYTKPAPVYPVRENSPRIPIDDDYGTKKVECEDTFLSAYEEGVFPITILRPAQTYGEGGVLIHTFGWSTTYIDRIRKGKPIVVHGDGNSLWNPCHVDDVAHAFVIAAGNKVSFGKAYNTTGEEVITWNQYHQKVAIALDAPSPKLIHIPTDLLVKISPDKCWITYNNFQGNNLFDNSNAKRDLDFRYSVSWIEGVKRTVSWLDENKKIIDSDNDPFDDEVIRIWEKHSNEIINTFQNKKQGEYYG
jgi:nucleoside-diphosphate-sugar epimerase